MKAILLIATLCNYVLGNLLLNDGDILAIWIEYFAELLGGGPAAEVTYVMSSTASHVRT